MLTVTDLVAGPSPVLRILTEGTDTQPDSSRVIEQVEVCTDQWILPDEVRHARDVLAVLPDTAHALADLRSALRALITRGVVALAFATPPDAAAPGTTAVLDMAHGMGLILLAPDRSTDTRRLQSDVMRKQITAMQVSAERRDRMTRLSKRLDLQGEGPAALLRYLARECGADVFLTEPGHPEWERLADEYEPTLVKLRSGQIPNADLVDSAGQHLTIHAIGGGEEPPHQVLAAIRSTPWPRPLKDLLDEATGMVRLLLHPLTRRAAERRLERSEAAVRVSLLQLLMMGEHFTAARVSEPLAPGVLSADTGRVAIVECAPGEDRAAVAREVEDLLMSADAEPRGIPIMCPIEDGHVIALIRQRAGAEESATGVLKSVAKPGRAIGVSTRVRWSRTPRGYKAAYRALITARQEPERISVRSGGTPLASVLPPSATVWAHAVVRRLRELPPDQRDMYVKTAGLVLAEGTKNAGKFGGVHPTTAGKRLAVVMECLGLDRSDLIDRAVCDLALQLAEDTADEGLPTPGLHSVLRGASEARQQAERFLTPLMERDAARDEGNLAFLTTWITSNGQLVETAAALNPPMHRNSLPPWLDRIGSVLELPLGRHDGAAHDVFWPLLLTSHLPMDLLSDPADTGEAMSEIIPHASDAQ